MPPPAGSGFLGEVGLTGRIHAVSGMGGRLATARAAGLTTVSCAGEPGAVPDGMRAVTVGHVADALGWAGFEGGPGPDGTAFPEPSEQAKRLEMGL